MGAKEGQGWALGTALVGRSERMFGDKVDLEGAYFPSDVVFVSAKDPHIRNAQASV